MISKDYQIFQSVARLESISKAAKELFLTQPVVTRHIQSLETELGYALFNRERGGIQLTDAGKSLMYSLESIRPICEKAQRDAADIAKGHFRVVTLGYASISFSPWFLHTLNSFCTEFSPMEINLVMDREPKLFRKLLFGDIDVIIVPKSNIQASEILFKPVFETIPYVYLRSDHHLVEKEQINLSDLAVEECVMLSPSGMPPYYLNYMSELTKNGLSSSQIKMTDSPESGLLYAGIGQGVFIAGDTTAPHAEAYGLVKKPLSVEGTNIKNTSIGFAYIKHELSSLVEVLTRCAAKAVEPVRHDESTLLDSHRDH